MVVVLVPCSTLVSMERSLCLITPDAVGQPWTERVLSKNDEDETVEITEVRAADKSDEIIARIRASGLRIVTQKTLRITKEQAMAFLRRDSESCGSCDALSSGLMVALVVEGDNAIARLLELCGPTDAAQARAESEARHPLNEELWTLRASFGTDGVRNAVHASADEFAALREVDFFFPQVAPYQRTLAFVKPDVVSEGKVDATVRNLEAAGFVVVAQKDVNVSQAQAEELYASSKGRSDFPSLVSSSIGSGVAIIAERKNAVRMWRLMAGPDRTRLHASASQADVEREIAVFFSAEDVPVERTLAMIKPGAADKHTRDIMRDVRAHGFTVLAQRRVHLSRAQAEAFYAEHEGRSFFDRLVTFMSSGPLVAMVLAKPAAIKCWRALLGPTNTATARKQAPTTIRARFGVDGTNNACHGSDSTASADRETRFFFPDFQPAALLTKGAARDFIAERPVATVFSAGGPVPKTLSSVLVEGITELCKARPAGLAAVEFLGKWLLQNNPRTGRVDDANVSQGATVGVGASAGGSGAVAVEVLETKMNEARTEHVDLGEGSVVFLLGGPGSGRTTLAQRISKGFGYEHISTGDLLRREVASGSALGREVREVLESGDLVDDATTLALVKTAMKRSGGRRFLIDGFPRSLAQAFAFEQSVQRPSFVLSLVASDEVMNARVKARAATSGRVDDAPSAFERRLATFRSDTAAVADFYQRLGVVHAVDASGSEDAVYNAAAKRLEPEVVFVLGPPAAGKSTQCKRIAAKYNYVHISTGALLRAEAKSGTRLGDEIRSIQAAGDLVPLNTTLSLMRRAMDERPGARFLIDGFPRTAEQAAAFRATVGSARRVIELQVDPAVSRARLAAVTQARRLDSSRDAVDRRLRVHAAATAPVIATYAAAGLVTRIDASAGPDEVFAQMSAALAPTIVFVLGGPGSGKGTQCARIRHEFGFTHLSAGDLLRAEVARNSADGAMIRRMISQGQIVPVDVTLGLLKRAMLASGNSRFLIDGYPRAMDQVAPFEEQVGAASFVLFFDASEAAMRARMAGRGRADDNEDAIAKRLRTFRQTSLPVVQAFARLGKVVRISADGSLDDVTALTRPVFLPDVVAVVGGDGPRRAAVAESVAADHGYTPLSSTALVRAEVTRGGALAEAARDALDAGGRAPAALVAALVAAVTRNSPSSKFVLADFPETADDVEALADAGLAITRAFVAPGADPDAVAALRRGGATAVHAAGDATAVLQPQLAVLVGSSGSGRGAFARRAGLSLGYHHLRVTELLRREMALGSADGVAIARAFRLGRTAPVDAVLRVLKKAIAGSRSRRFLLDGFPRVVSDGFPGVHDQLFALEERVGPVKAVVCLSAGVEERRKRIGGTPTKGDVAALERSMDAFQREKMPVVQFFGNLGRVTMVRAGRRGRTRLRMWGMCLRRAWHVVVVVCGCGCGWVGGCGAWVRGGSKQKTLTNVRVCVDVDVNVYVYVYVLPSLFRWTPWTRPLMLCSRRRARHWHKLLSFCQEASAPRGRAAVRLFVAASEGLCFSP